VHSSQNVIGVSGTLGIQVLRGAQARARALGLDAPVVTAHWTWRLRNLPKLLSGMWRVALAHVFTAITGFPVAYGSLYLRKFDGARQVWVDYGLVGLKVVTTAGVGYIVDAFQNSVELENQKFHAFGTGTNAEASGDTALQTELTTQYATDNTRPTGTTTENGANVYRTVATFSPDSGGTIAVTEHGILSQAATGGGVLLDRTVFSAVNVVAGSDSIQSTYDITFTAGS
jgi:hypothetical protein